MSAWRTTVRPLAALLLTLPAALALPVIAAAEPAAVDAGERLPATHVLADGPLAIQVMDPLDPARYDRGVRFTPLAAVLRARLAGHEFLHSPATHDPLNDSGGLAAEFDLCIPGGPADDLPPGWAAATVDGGFLKIGVGVLAKGREPYHLFQHPALLVPAVTTVLWSTARAVFHQTCDGGTAAPGYGYALTADLSVAGERVTVAWTLANTGAKPFTTRQYSHNFIRIDDHDVGPGYTLGFPYPITPTGLLAEQAAAERSIAFLRPIPTWVNLVVPWPDDYSGPNTLTLAHASGPAVECSVSLPGLRTAVHARRGYCAPEQFVRLEVAPGAEVRWERGYRFRVEP